MSDCDTTIFMEVARAMGDRASPLRASILDIQPTSMPQ